MYSLFVESQVCHVYKSMECKFILREFNLLHVLVYRFSYIYFNVIFLDVLRFSNQFLYCYGCAAHSSHTFMCDACLCQPVFPVEERNI